ncbi:MAG: NUDIX hydrolase [Verrucomicrobiaceae bacterium]|nr:NUDIX hydrolase [Verrucomicrobiaceae bacterium]
MNRNWITQSSEVVYGARPWLELRREAVELPSGRVLRDFHQVWLADYAIICAETDDGQVLLARLYKHGIRDVSLIFPGGAIAEGEDPLEAAKRELLEETGYEAREWKKMSRLVVHANYGAGHACFFHAKGLTKVCEPAHDDTEEITVEFYPRSEVRGLVERGEIVLLDCVAMLGVMGM